MPRGVKDAIEAPSPANELLCARDISTEPEWESRRGSSCPTVIPRNNRTK